MSAEDIRHLELLVNGERAADSRMEQLEYLATDLLEPMPILVTRVYGYTGDNDAAMLLRTYRIEKAETDDTDVEVALCRTNDMKLKFVMAYDAANGLKQMRFSSKDGDTLGEAYLIACDLLQSGLVDGEGKALAEHLRHAIEVSAGIQEQQACMADDATPGGDEALHVADLTRLIVQFNTEFEVCSRTFEEKLNDTDKISILEQAVRGSLTGVDLREFPVLQIFHGTHAGDEGNSYIKRLDGVRSLKPVDTKRSPEPEDMKPIDRRAWGFDQPSRQDVSILIEKLTHTSSRQAPPASP